MKFEYPQLLWLLPLVPALIVAFLWWSARARQALLTRFVHARLLSDLTVGISPARQRTRMILLASAGALLVLALARPQWGFSWEEAKQRGLDIIVAIDTSRSMLAEDIKPNRLDRAKLAALDLMQQAQADRLGLIAFAGGAFLQCPLTLDDGAFRQCVDALNVDIIPQGGTAVAEAIRTAVSALKDDENFKVLVLFSDGEDHDPGALEAAREASEAGMRVFTIGLGTPEGELLRIRDAEGRVDYVRDAEGQVVKSRLNESLLQQIAGEAQGFYLPLRGANTVDTLYEKGLAPLPKSASEARLYQRYHEHYHWPLGLAILLLLAESVIPQRRKPKATTGVTTTPAGAAILLLLVMVWPFRTDASSASAARDYQAGNFNQAQEEYDRLREEHAEDQRLHYNAGAGAFRAGNFEDAIQRFGLATGAPDLQLQQSAYYNRGNAYYRAGESAQKSDEMKQSWEQAVKDYEIALKLNPGDPDAQFNLEFVNKRLEELEQQEQEQDNEQDDQDSEENEDQQNQDQQSDQNQDQDQQDDSEQDQQNNEDQDSKEQDSQEQDPQQSEDEQQEQQSEEPSNEDQPQEGEPSEEDTPQSGQPTEPGTMTPEQAQQLMDNLKGEEQMLPIKASPQQQQPPAKNW